MFKLLSLASILCAPLAVAQDEPLLPHVGVLGSNRAIPEDGTPAAFGRTVAGDFDGDLVLDVAALEGQRLHIMLAPSAYEAQMVHVAQASDMVVVPSTTGDTLIVASATGPVLLEWNLGDRWWNPIPLDLPGWEGVERLAFASAPLGHWLIGVDVDQSTLRCAYTDTPVVTASSPWGTNTAWASPVPLQDFSLLNFDGQGGREIALASSAGLRIHSLPVVAGSSLATVALPGLAEADLAVLGEAGKAAEFLACVGKSSDWGETQHLAVFGPQGLVDSLPLGGIGEVVGMAVGDYDLDGRDDLCVSRTEDWDLGLLLWQGTGAPDFELSNQTAPGSIFAPSQRLVTGVEPSAAGNQAVPVLADLDGDGDLDAAYPIQLGRKLWVGIESLVIDHLPFIPAVKTEVFQVVVSGSEDDTLQDVTVGGYMGNVGGLDLELVCGAVPAGATHVEVLAWAQGTLELSIDPDQVTWSLLEVGTLGAGESVPLRLDLTTLPGAYGHDDLECLLYLCVRLVVCDPMTTEVTHRFPARTIGMQFENQWGPQDNQDFLLGIQPPAMQLDSFVFWDYDREDRLLGVESAAQQNNGDDENDGSGHGIPCLPLGPNNVPRIR